MRRLREEADLHGGERPISALVEAFRYGRRFLATVRRMVGGADRQGRASPQAAPGLAQAGMGRSWIRVTEIETAKTLYSAMDEP